MNSRVADDPSGVLERYLHEQLHWALGGQEDILQHLTHVFRNRYPGIPTTPPDGASDEWPTYLHVIVCALSYAALEDLTGMDEARRVFEANARIFYRVIHRLVLDHHAAIMETIRAARLRWVRG